MVTLTVMVMSSTARMTLAMKFVVIMVVATMALVALVMHITTVTEWHW